MVKKILIYNSGGGLVDTSQLFPFILSLKNHVKSSDFYYLLAHQNHFVRKLKNYNIQIQTLDLRLQYFGFRWWHALIIKNKIKKHNIETFDLIIDLQSKIRNSLILKILPHKYFVSSCLNFRISKPSLELRKHKKLNNTILTAIN